MDRLIIAQIFLSWIMGVAISLICLSLGASWIIAEVISTIVGFGIGFVWRFALR